MNGLSSFTKSWIKLVEKYKELGRVTSRDMGAQFKEVIREFKKNVYVYKEKIW